MEPCDTTGLDCEEVVKTRKRVIRETIRRNGKKIRIKRIIRQKVIVKCCTKPISFCEPRPDIAAPCPPFFPQRNDYSIFRSKGKFS